MTAKKPNTAKKTAPKSTSGDYRPQGNVSQHKKATPPPLGEAFGDYWGKVNGNQLILPNGGAMSFDFTKLTLSDYREMLNNYQIKSSLESLNFILHQATWTIECENKKIADHCTENMNRIWTQLNAALGQAHWAGYSPSILQWENNTGDKYIELAKIKDLVPESATINWKEVDGWAPPGEKPPKHRIYDGIREFGSRWPVPSENSLWYPFRMQNGDYGGTKLLQSAYIPYYFSNLIHLFNSRFLERFGEPAMTGRVPMGDEVDLGGGETMDAGQYMLRQMQNLRNGAVSVLPNDMAQGSESKFEYEIEYLESQMRGADFERYLTRLDEEMSLALFTPLLLMRTGDSGSYNQSSTHMQMFLWGLNALNGDRKLYIDKYILNRMVDFNFGPKAPRARIRFRKMGNDNADLIKQVATLMVNGKIAKVDLDELSEAAGIQFQEMTDEEARQAVERGGGGSQAVPGADDDDDVSVGKSNDPDPGGNPNNPDPGAGKRKRTKKGKPSDTA